MNKKKQLLFVTLMLASASVFAVQERVIKVQNHVRVGYDDNIYATENDEQDTGFITDILNLSATFNFSERTDLVLYWQPEVQYRFDADPDVVTYQDVYARLSHALSQRVFMEVSNRLRYQDKEGQADFAGGDRENQNYIENTLMGSLGFTIDQLSTVSVGAGYTYRQWDDDDYGKGDLNNNFGMVNLDVNYARELKPDTTVGVLGMGYSNLDYDGDRGGYDSFTFYTGVDQTFSPSLTGTARVGASINSVEYRDDTEDTTSPFFEAGLGYEASEQTIINGTIGYSLARSDSAGYSAQNDFTIGAGITHDLTAKISASSSLKYTYSTYDGDYGGGNGDSDAAYISWSLRGSYQVNRNNFVEAGYQYSDRSGDFSVYSRNRIDMGWRLRL